MDLYVVGLVSVSRVSVSAWSVCECVYGAEKLAETMLLAGEGEGCEDEVVITLKQKSLVSCLWEIPSDALFRNRLQPRWILLCPCLSQSEMEDKIQDGLVNYR